MDTIPNELIDKILVNINWRGVDNKLAQYSCISRKWQANIEKRLFKRISLKVPQHLETFAAVFAGPNISRLQHVKDLHVTFVLPSLASDGCCDVQRIPNREEDCASFSSSVCRLLSILSELETRRALNPELRIGFSQAYREIGSRPLHSVNWGPCEAELDRQKHDLEDVQEARARFGHFELENPGEICTVKGVAAFYFSDYLELRDLRLSSVSHVLHRLPNLRDLKLTSRDKYEWGRMQREMRRFYFAESIRMCPRDHLRKLYIRIYHDAMKNEDEHPHKFINQNSCYTDTWYSVLKTFSESPVLEVLCLTGGIVTSPGVFRSITDSEGDMFTALKELVFEFSPETADGRWFFERDEDVFARARADPKHAEFWKSRERKRINEWLNAQDDALVFEEGPVSTDLVPRDHFRTLPNPDTFRALLIGAAEAKARLPQLEIFTLRLHDWATHTLQKDDLDYPFLVRVFELLYVQSGMPNFVRPVDHDCLPAIYQPRKRSVTWRVGTWRPWDDVQAAWCGVTGFDTDVIFVEECIQSAELKTYTKVHRGRF